MRLVLGRSVLFLLGAIFVSCAHNQAKGQGCIAARSNQGIIGELCGRGPLAHDDTDHNPPWLRRLTVDIGFREFTSFRKGRLVKATADQSLQPGDCRWGFALSTQAYRQVAWHTMLYFQGSWLFNPADTNGVPTFRSRPGEQVMSVTDQYLFRGGFSHGVPKIKPLSLSLGGRMEGIPVRDAFGASNGFRRPGYIISIDPGVMYSFRHETLSVNGPWALERNRRRSVPDIANGAHGDAAFADYTIIAVLSHRF